MADALVTPEPPRAKRGCCIHYTVAIGPHAQPKCRAGVVYAELVGTADGWAGRLPCNAMKMHAERPPVPCASRQEPTEEQIAAFRAFVDGRFEKLAEALRRVAASHKQTQAWGGTVECPACAGRLHWTKARLNGHVWGRCETEGCLSWMQ